MVTIYWQRNGSLIRFSYGGDFRNEMSYLYYTFREAYKKYKEKYGIERAHSEKVNWLI